MIRAVGFLLIVAGASAVGFSIAADVKRQTEFYRKLLVTLGRIKAEIEFRLTPIGEICNLLSNTEEKTLGGVFAAVHRTLLDCPGRPLGVLMHQALNTGAERIPQNGKMIIEELFGALGKQDLLAQVRAVEFAESRAQSALDNIEKEKSDRCRTYRTIGVCAGLAVAVILI